MHKDEVKGAAKEARGHVKDAIGKVTGDEMSGTLDMGEYLSGRWSARRKARRG